MLRSCAVWLIGVQREANEVKRAIANMPEGMKRPKAGDVATLELGQFFACYGREIRKTYVQPAWMDKEVARKVAAGMIELEHIPSSLQDMKRKAAGVAFAAGFESLGQSMVCPKEPCPQRWNCLKAGECLAAKEAPAQTFAVQEEVMPPQKTYSEEELLRAANPSPELKGVFQGFVRALLPFLNGQAAESMASTLASQAAAQRAAPSSSVSPAYGPEAGQMVELVAARVLGQIRRDPVLIKLALEAPVIEVTINRKTVAMDGATIKGKIATLIHGKWFNGGSKTFGEVREELIHRGLERKTANVQISAQLREFVDMGFFWQSEGGSYELAPGAESRVEPR